MTIDDLNLKHSFFLLDLLIEKLQIRNFYVSPGMRCAPLIYALEKIKEEKDFIKVFSVIDERQGAFRALGSTRGGVKAACICTSGSAVANYLPAIVEGSEDRVPFIALTGDRPERLRGSDSNQTINQKKIFGNFAVFNNINASIDIDRMQISISTEKPIHLNLEFEEPLVPIDLSNEVLDNYFASLPNTVFESKLVLQKAKVLTLNEVKKYLVDKKNTFIVVGEKANISLELLQMIQNNPHYIDITSGVKGLRMDTFFDVEDSRCLGFIFEKFDSIIHFGGKIISNNYYRKLDKEKIKEIWIDNKFPERIISDRVEIHGDLNEQDCLDLIESITVSNNKHFSYKDRPLLNHGRESQVSEHSQDSQDSLVNEILGIQNQQSFNLMIGNSSVIRSFNNSIAKKFKGKLFFNRGASGIDGNISTFRGLVESNPDSLNYLVIGDVSLSHDFSSFIELLKSDLLNYKIIIINNSGGQIFNYLPIGKTEIGLSKLMLTPNPIEINDLPNNLKLLGKTIVESFDTELKLFSENSNKFLEVIIDIKNDLGN